MKEESEMTSYERVMTALEGKKPERTSVLGYPAGRVYGVGDNRGCGVPAITPLETVATMFGAAKGY